jgi:hypothetical protein
MQENVFRELLGHSIVKEVLVCQGLALKGKPARRSGRDALVWRVKVSIAGIPEFLEAARGGAREWASLDKLMGWLKMRGVGSCRLEFYDGHQDHLQGKLSFSKP